MSTDVILRQLPWLARLPAHGEQASTAASRRSKRTLDVGLILLSAPALVPVLFVCAALLKLESPAAPVFYRQQRTGLKGRRFPMLKFRTMVPNADELKEKLAHLNQLAWPDFKIENDPRVTRVGRFLRRWSLDELPQLVNVLRGEMSLVGPRPTSFGVEKYEDWQKARLDAVPGITGLYQIVGRGTMDFDVRVHYDLVYIERQCALLDIQLLLRTAGTVLGGRGTC